MKESVVTAASPAAQQLYRDLIGTIRTLGPFEAELKKTSVHLVRASAFAGVQFRRQYLLVTIKSDAPIKSQRVIKLEQVSKNRWHSEVKLSSDADFDSQLLVWLKAAYDLCA
jgi:Domain of unknown function (DUF5655)